MDSGNALEDTGYRATCGRRGLASADGFLGVASRQFGKGQVRRVDDLTLQEQDIPCCVTWSRGYCLVGQLLGFTDSIAGNLCMSRSGPEFPEACNGDSSPCLQAGWLDGTIQQQDHLKEM